MPDEASAGIDPATLAAGFATGAFTIDASGTVASVFGASAFDASAFDASAFDASAFDASAPRASACGACATDPSVPDPLAAEVASTDVSAVPAALAADGDLGRRRRGSGAGAWIGSGPRSSCSLFMRVVPVENC